MVRHNRRFIGLLLPIALVGLNILSFEAFGQKAQKGSKETIAFTPPILSVIAEPAVVTACSIEGNASLVHLDARATSPDGYPIRYRWSASAGRIEGNGATVTWDLSGVQ